MPSITHTHTWTTLSRKQNSKVMSSLHSWKGTPYRELDRIKAMGVDCFQLIAAFLDEMFDCKPGTTQLPRLSASTSRNNPGAAQPAISCLRRAHHGSEEVDDGTIQTGDILVVRSILRTDGHRYEGHTMIAGENPWSVLHAVRPKVDWTSCEGRDIVKIYRPREKQLWI